MDPARRQAAHSAADAAQAASQTLAPLSIPLPPSKRPSAKVLLKGAQPPRAVNENTTSETGAYTRREASKDGVGLAPLGR